MSLGARGMETNRILVGQNRFVELAGYTERLAQMMQNLRPPGINLERTAIEGLGVGERRLEVTRLAHDMERINVVGPRRQHNLGQTFGGRKLPTIQMCQSLPQERVNLLLIKLGLSLH